MLKYPGCIVYPNAGRGRPITLFLTKHQHNGQTCPAGDAQMGPMLLQHLSDDNAPQAGINIRGDAVLDDHTFYMILEAPSIEVVQQLMTPFTHVGRVEIMEDSSCGQVVARGSCGAGGKVWSGGVAI